VGKYVKPLAMVLAGGKGERLFPLTRHRTKPAVHFGGIYRLIDFVLSNLVNSGIYSIYVLTQYKAQSLLRHLQLGWVGAYPMNSFFILPVPAQMRMRETWYLGTADAIYQNIYLIKQFKPDIVLVFSADHVYFMNVRQMIDYHLAKGADVTVATIQFPISECSRFGVVSIDKNWQIIEFQEKPPQPTPMPDCPDKGLVSMGNYIFNTEVLLEELVKDAEDENSSHDFGKDILPRICKTRRVFAYNFCSNRIPGIEEEMYYWRDVGTIASYYEANMDLKNPLPSLNLYNPKWPVRSVKYHDPPAKIVVDAEGRVGHLENSLIAGGSIVSGGWVRDSIIGRNVFIDSRAVVEESIIIGNVVVGKNAHIRRAIIDEGNVIPEGDRIGYDLNKDAERFYVDTASGIVVVPKKLD
jgi:glucose-1-phosphate adenylyltransferase